MAGRGEDALHIVEQQPLENLTQFGWANRAMIYAETGDVKSARAAANEALAKYPDLNIEGMINNPFNDSERQKVIETMRTAGFPLCAKPDELKALANPIHLPECVPTATQ